MITLPWVFMPEQELEFLDEIEKLDRIVDRIRSIQVDPATLVYCGVEGRPMLNTGKLQPKPTTFGMTYEDFRYHAGARDKFGSSNTIHPLQYALDVDDVPALIGYQQDQLIESGRAPYVWLPRHDASLQDAARVFIFFAE